MVIIKAFLPLLRVAYGPEATVERSSWKKKKKNCNTVMENYLITT